MTLPRETDVFIAGGGPAGLAAAIAARERGLRVLVADASHPPIEKPCGEGLMPDALAALCRLGVSIGPEVSYPFSGIRFLGGGAVSEASFPDGCGLGVRRPALHQLLVGRAAEGGASLCWNTRVSRVCAEGVVLDNGMVRSRWIIGADGVNSRVRLWAGLDRCTHNATRFGFRRHYRVAPWSDCVEIYWGDTGQFYITPVSRQEICVVFLSRDRRQRIDDALPKFPELQARLRGDGRGAGRDLRFTPVPQRSSRTGRAYRRCVGLRRCGYGRRALPRVSPGLGSGGCTGIGRTSVV